MLTKISLYECTYTCKRVYTCYMKSKACEYIYIPSVLGVVWIMTLIIAASYKMNAV